MKRILLLLASFSLFTFNAAAQMGNMNMPGDEKPEAILPGLGTLHHPVSTRNAQAQRFFDQGLRLVYAFNHEEAVRSFKRAAELDPKLAMAYWGIGYALGPNINADVDPEREKAAYEATQQALKLESGAPANERDYIDALAKRYSIDPKADLKTLAVDFHHAMGALMHRYPNDLDAATLYAESGMDLRPWQLWTNDGKPAEGTEEIVSVLESVLKRNPNHIGAVHYYIHAVEASPHPERALPYVSKLPAEMPTAGHLVHMPAHIYIRTGNYLAAAKSNQDAIAADDAYIKRTGANGIYTLMYYNHNVHFLAVADSMAGKSAESLKAAHRLEENLAPVVKEMPMVEPFLAVPAALLVRFHKWGEILRLRQPDAQQQLTTYMWHYARGAAFAAQGDPAQADQEFQQLLTIKAAQAADAIWGLNRAVDVMAVGENDLAGRIALARKDSPGAIAAWQKAVTAEDALSYDEPPDWISPVREALGGVLLRSGDAVGAEKVFRADLEKHRLDGRSLFGLAESLKSEGKLREAAVVRRQFAVAWREADVKLTVAEL